MSVNVATILKGGSSIIFAGDSRLCVYKNGIAYTISDNSTKIFKHVEADMIFYCSGYTRMSEEAANKIMSCPANKLSNRVITQILTDTYNKYIDDVQGEFKHLLQVVIPVLNNNKWEIHFYDRDQDDPDFIPLIITPPTDINFTFAIGSGGKIVQEYIDEAFSQNELLDPVKVFQEAFTEASGEQCGGNMKLYVLSKDVGVERDAVIPDKRPIRRWDNNNVSLFNIHAQGDGMVVSSTGQNISGVAKIEKPNGMWSLIYRSNNSAKERRLIFKDEGLELSTENGDLVVGHDVGSFIKFKANGDIDINCMGKLTVNGKAYDFK